MLPPPPKQRRHIEGHRTKQALKQKAKQRKLKEGLIARVKDFERKQAEEAREREERRRWSNTYTTPSLFPQDDTLWY